MLYYFTHYVSRQDPIWGFNPFGLFNGVGLIVRHYWSCVVTSARRAIWQAKL